MLYGGSGMRTSAFVILNRGDGEMNFKTNFYMKIILIKIKTKLRNIKFDFVNI